MRPVVERMIRLTMICGLVFCASFVVAVAGMGDTFSAENEARRQAYITVMRVPVLAGLFLTPLFWVAGLIRIWLRFR